MSEAIIARRGSKLSGAPVLMTVFQVSNNNWTVPNNIVNNTVSVRIFGGGGAGTNQRGSGGGGGGWMNNAEGKALELKR